MNAAKPLCLPAPRRPTASAALATCASILLVGMLCGQPYAWAQAAAPTPAAQQRATGPKAESAPRWSELSTPQRQALKPLATAWTGLSTAHKRKWIALSRNFDELPEDEKRKLHERMGEWSKLSAVERSQARHNFVATEKISSDDKQAKWQAYQALSDDERHKLAEQAPRRLPPGAATAVRLVPQQRLTKAPGAADNAGMPRIAAAPHQIDRNTLLPQIDRYEPEHDGSSAK